MSLYLKLNLLEEPLVVGKLAVFLGRITESVSSSILVANIEANAVTLFTFSVLSDFQPPDPSKETLDCTEGGRERLGEGHVGDLMIFFSIFFVSSKPKSSFFGLIGEGVLTGDIENVGKYQKFQNLPLGQTHDKMTNPSNMSFWYILTYKSSTRHKEGDSIANMCTFSTKKHYDT